MADWQNRFAQNIAGPYYVDDQCIACDACVVEAPDFFEMNDLDGHAFVRRQPKTEAEIKNCEEALDCCPVEAIGRDGK